MSYINNIRNYNFRRKEEFYKYDVSVWMCLRCGPFRLKADVISAEMDLSCNLFIWSSICYILSLTQNITKRCLFNFIYLKVNINRSLSRWRQKNYKNYDYTQKTLILIQLSCVKTSCAIYPEGGCLPFIPKQRVEVGRKHKQLLN